MEILLLLIPLSVVLVVAHRRGVLVVACGSGQFDDLEGPAHRILADDDRATHRRRAATPPRRRHVDFDQSGAGAIARSISACVQRWRPGMARPMLSGRRAMATAAQPTTYNYKVVRQFALMTVVWGIVGMLVGVIIAAQLLWPELNFDIPWLSYGRLRPLHTNAVIFAFGGCALFATSLLRRAAHLPGAPVLRRARGVHVLGLAGGHRAGRDHAAARLSRRGKEYAELEWPIDILITLVWVSYAVVFFGTHREAQDQAHLRRQLVLRRLHPHRRAAAPRQQRRDPGQHAGSRTRPTPACRTRWCSGGTATTRSGFFLTAGFLGMMYYFVPKQAGRPIYSYRLSVVHFWALIFTYMWAGPHHLHYTALPDWTQSLGMVFSLILLAPSWGGMINGIMTLSGAWHKLRDDPILKFLIVVAVVLRHVDLRGADDVDQDRQRAVALHRLDHRPRALRRARLGRDVIRSAACTT